MSADGLALRPEAVRGVPPAVPGDVGSDILVACDRFGIGRFEIFAGIRSPYLQLAGHRLLLVGEGARVCLHRAAVAGGTLRIGGAGVFRNDGARERLSTSCGGESHRCWRLRIPQAGTLEGPFRVTMLEASGRAGEDWFFELGSTGPLSFRAS